MNMLKSMHKKSLPIIGIGVFLLFCIALWLYGINDPYVGSYNANNNYLTLAAKNYLRFGIVNLFTLPTYFAGNPLPPKPEYYLHHPYLFFLLNTIPFAIFGFSNWVVHVFPLFFSLGTIVITYVLVRRVFGTRIAWLFGLISLCLPASVLFWKFMMFEQSSLFFVMATTYAFIRYRDTGYLRYLYLGALVSLLATLCDWYGAYFLFACMVALLWIKKTRTIRFLLTYICSVFVALFGFLAIIYVVKGNFFDIWSAVSVRAVSNELFALPLWPIRYAILLGIRSIVYFSSLILLVIIGKLNYPMRLRTIFSDEKALVWVLFGIIGILNCIALPTATWGHSYFLYPLIPFVALTMATAFSRYSGKIRLMLIFFLLCWSAVVQKAKYDQISKLYWKFDAAKTVSGKIRAYEPVGTVDFPGDVFEQYFLHASVPMEISDASLWIQGIKHPEVTTVVVSCYGSCSGERLEMIHRYTKSGIPFSKIGSDERALWVFSKTKAKNYTLPDIQTSSGSGFQNDSGIWYMKVYRFIRNSLGVVQI